MDQGWHTLIGMSIAYVASFLGMGMAWYGWKRRHGSAVGPGNDSGKLHPTGDREHEL